jgi:hypothetical protein
LELSFTIDTKTFRRCLNRIFKYNLNRNEEIKISVSDESIELFGKGVMQKLNAKTNGCGDVMLPVKLLLGYLQNFTAASISFTFRNAELECGSSIFSSSAIVVGDSLAKPDAELPINLSAKNILRFTTDKSSEEIEKAGLIKSYQSQKKKLRNKIFLASVLLKDYDVTFDDLNELIQKKTGIKA